MGKNKQLILNLSATLSVLLINIGMNFFLTPYIVEHIGTEANGFISLANNFISYASILTIALNSMAGRFITIEIHKNNMKNANEYFNSVLISNVIIIALLIIPAICVIFFLENLINIPANLLIDVKILFTFIFLNFFLTLVAGVFNVSTYCVNKLYLSAIKNMQSNILKVILLILLFMFFVPKVFYIGLVTMVCTAFVMIAHIRFTKKLLPEIKIDTSKFSKSKVKTLLSAGVWNSITNLGNVLSDGLDLMISNIMISAKTMGEVALAKIPANIISNIIASIASIFQPQMAICYAKGDEKGLLSELKTALKITGFFSNIPFAVIVVLGHMFFSLWIPNENIDLITTLSLITFLNVLMSGIITPMYNIYTILNKVKIDSIVRIFSGILSTTIVFILLNTTDLGVYAVVGVSAVMGIFVNVTFVPLYISKCLKVKWTTFYKVILRYIITTIIMLGTFILIKQLFITYSWLNLIIAGFVMGCTGVIINYFVLLNKEEKKYIRDFVVKIIKEKMNKGKEEEKLKNEDDETDK